MAKAPTGAKAAGKPTEAEPEPSVTEALDSFGASIEQAEAATTKPSPDLSEAAHERVISNMENIANELMLADKSLVAGVRDFMLDIIKSQPVTYGAVGESRQRDIATAADEAAKAAVRKIIETIATRTTHAVRVILSKIAIGDDTVITGKVKVFPGEDEDLVIKTLHHARGKFVMLTVASVDDFDEDHPDVEVDPDQRNMEFASGPVGDEDLGGADFGVFDDAETVWLVRADEGAEPEWSEFVAQAKRLTHVEAQRLAAAHDGIARALP
jgi:hypothetical protein